MGVGGDGRLHRSPAFVAELAAYCSSELDLCVPQVSKWSYGKQVEHLYLGTHWVLDRIDEAMTGQYPSRKMGWMGYGLMMTGFIPRGVFPTIPPLIPASGTMEHIQPLQDRLIKRLDQITWDLEQIKASSGKSLHPKMKYLTTQQWLFFADVHHRHHGKIIRDILKAASGDREETRQALESRRRA